MLTQEFLKDILSYNALAGQFTWIKPPAHLARLIGTIAGSTRKDGYIRIYIGGKRHYAHRLAWLYFYGEIPEGIDHINQNKSDNRISNLRSVSHSENMRNRRRSSNNTSGATGVVFSKRDRKWVAQIHMNNSAKYLGSFENIEDAIAARKNASRDNGFTELHG